MKNQQSRNCHLMALAFLVLGTVWIIKLPASLAVESQPEQNTSIAAGEDAHALATKLCSVMIAMNVSHTSHAVDKFVVCPYLTRPPEITKPIMLFPLSGKKLEKMLFNAGYTSRSNTSKVYQPLGWRWEYCFEQALKKHRGELPHTVLQAYPWARSMVDYILPQIKHSNAIEISRKSRYDNLYEAYQKSGVDVENDAARNGLYPIVIRFNKRFQAQTQVAPGTWWVTGIRKVPGLTYYWQFPFKAISGHTAAVQLNEDNALLIQGNW